MARGFTFIAKLIDAMLYNSQTLLPWSALKANDRKLIRTRAPLTPFFFSEQTGSITKVTRVFSGGGFFEQNHRNRFTSGPELEAICGAEMFQKWTGEYSITGSKWTRANGSTTCAAYTGSKTITRTRTMTFNETLKKVSVEWDEAEESSGEYFSRSFPSENIEMTATTATMHAQWDAQNGCEYWNKEGIETLSEAVTVGHVDGWLAEWMGKPIEFRHATQAGVVDAQAGFNLCATRSQSTSAQYYKVSGGQVKTLSTWFKDSWTSGMVGSLAKLWNGNFTVILCLRRRMNRPTIYREPTKISNGNETFTVNPGLNFANYGIYTKVSYPNGVVEEELEDDTSNHWALYGGGEFEWNPNTSPDSVLANTPLKPVESAYGFLSVAYPGYVYLGQLNLISRTGRRYRITIQLGELQYNEETWEESMNWHTEHVLETDPETLRVPFRVDLDPEGSFPEARIFRLEQWTGNDEEPWRIIAESGHDMLPDPATMISDKVTTPGIHLLAAIQQRIGSSFGFFSFDWNSTSRYRKRTFRSNRTTPLAGDPGVAGCGGAYPEGTAAYEYSEEYVEGELKPKQVIAHSLQVGGVDWTNPNHVPYENSSMPPNWNEELLTPTLRRVSHSGESVDYGHSGPLLDTPDPDGRILETVYVALPVSAVGNQNTTEWTDLLPPAAESTVFAEAQRLTYTQLS